MSIKVPYTVNSNSSAGRSKLFASKSHVHCNNKIEMQFISRSRRDLFLLAHKAFICREELRNSVIVDKI